VKELLENASELARHYEVGLDSVGRWPVFEVPFESARCKLHFRFLFPNKPPHDKNQECLGQSRISLAPRFGKHGRRSEKS
jgi:hypothetical protein